MAEPLSSYALRDASMDDVERLREVERAAGVCFVEVGMPEVAGDEPLPVEVLARYQRGGRVRVLVDHEGLVVAYLLVDDVDGCVHVEQVSVDPVHAGHGLGRRLLDDASDRARGAGVPALTLTTFRDVPWNGPYYARLGFRTLAEPDWTPGLRAIRTAEAAHGLDRWPRVCMRRDV